MHRATLSRPRGARSAAERTAEVIDAAQQDHLSQGCHPWSRKISADFVRTAWAGSDEGVNSARVGRLEFHCAWRPFAGQPVPILYTERVAASA